MLLQLSLMTPAIHQRQLDVLENKSFEGLMIWRSESSCYLVIAADGEKHVHLNKQGEKKIFRHAWQIKEWLKDQYGIDESQIDCASF